MTYDFFNAGHLAFGKKLTSVFNSLNQLLLGATDHLQSITDALGYYSQFNNKNYLAPFPNRGDMPARTDEIFNLFDEYTQFKKIESDGTTTTFELTIFDKNSSRITNAVGNTTLKEGYAFVKLSTSLDNFTKTIRFSTNSEPNTGEVTICRFAVDGTNVLIYDPNSSTDLNLSVGEMVNYRDLAITYVGSGDYTCNTRAECIIARGGSSSGLFKITLNGTEIFSIGFLQFGIPYTVVYLRKGDKLSGASSYYRVDYIK